MYLKQIAIENSGPVEKLDLNLDFTEDGAPKPLILVGPNGGGKTNILSLVTDALFEGAAAHFDNVLPTRGIGRSWFRLVGGRTIRVGSQGSFSLLRFDNAGTTVTYKEKAGKFVAEEAAKRLNEEIAAAAVWPDEGSVKEIDLSDEDAYRVFAEGVYVYFPSSRSETPFWMNREAIPDTEFDLAPTFSKRLRKPLLVERGLHQLKQWIISVITEARMDVQFNVGLDGQPHFTIAGEPAHTVLALQAWQQCNLILQKILDDDQVRFVWLGRKSSDKLAVARGNATILPNLDALSSGQATLLALFGTLLMYGDQSQQGAALDMSAIRGICVVDEIDSHVHVDLQHRVLPALVKLFPRIQFVLSSHSPLFILGMQKEFGDSGFQLVEMPDGKVVTAETYSEFGKAMDALSATKAFNEALLADQGKDARPIIYVEGETDSPYLRRAAEVLDRTEILERCEIEWIGAKDEGGQGISTGKNSLNHALAFLRANPSLSKRPVLLLYDNDAHKLDADYAIVSVRGMPTNDANTKVRAGIENLLPEAAITEEDYHISETVKDNGSQVTTKTLRKVELCKRICAEGTDTEFAGFSPALDVIATYLDDVAPSQGH